MRHLLISIVVLLLISSCKKESIPRSESLLPGIALRYKGTPYKYGGNTREGMDCSGLVYRAFAELDRPFPRSSYEQADVFQTVSKPHLREGDLLYFKIGKTARINHTGIVTKIVNKETVMFIHSSSSAGVREDNLYSKYWEPKFVKATRPKL
jgi:probable lipoprotein NlpC